MTTMTTRLTPAQSRFYKMDDPPMNADGTPALRLVAERTPAMLDVRRAHPTAPGEIRVQILVREPDGARSLTLTREQVLDLVAWLQNQATRS